MGQAEGSFIKLVKGSQLLQDSKLPSISIAFNHI